jgi:hypothetical protein
MLDQKTRSVPVTAESDIVGSSIEVFASGSPLETDPGGVLSEGNRGRFVPVIFGLGVDISSAGLR